MELLVDYLPYLFSGLLLVSLFSCFILIHFFPYLLKDRESRAIKVLEERNRALAATAELNSIILETLDFKETTQRIANAIPRYLGYQTGVLAVVDEKRGVLKRVAISETSGGEAALTSLEIPFQTIEIGMDQTENLCIKVLKDNRSYITTSLYDVLRPVVSLENSQEVQRRMGTKTTFVYPIFSGDGKPLGAFLLSMDKDANKVSDIEKHIIDNFVNGVRIALVNSSLYTSLKETRDNLSRVNEQLSELDHLKDDFVSVASHELRTPMTAIRSYAWMALNRSDIPLSDKLHRYVERIFISTERLINLVNDMLNISRIESGRVEVLPEVFDIKKLADEVLIEIGPKAAEKKLNVRMFSENVPQVFADVDKVHQVLLNLLGNAMKFTPNEGNITVSFFTDGKMVDVSVKDSGVGISQEDLGRLFKKFGRLDNSYVAAATSGGTGLGLYISKSLIELMKGKVWVQSEGVGKGSTFTFSLPVATAEVLANKDKYSLKLASNQVKYLEPMPI